MKRRSFLQQSLALLGATVSSNSAFGFGALNSTKPLNLLVLGGTNFVGPAIVEEALARGHNVTIFNRGITRPHLFNDLEKLRGFRGEAENDLRALEGRRRWDVVIDVWPSKPALVEETTKLLAERADFYFFVSSIAAYRDFSKPGIVETAPAREGEQGYGGEKVASESIVANIFEGRYGIARCHSILGARDPGSTLHYWLRRFHQHNEVVAPGTGNDPIQFVDVKDVSSWAIRSIESKRTGVYNLVSSPIQFSKFLNLCSDAVGSSAQQVWLSPQFLMEQGVGSFVEMPLWAPLSEDPGFFQITADKAKEAGMQFRSYEKTIADAWRWYQSAFFNETTFPQNGWGISRAREEELLKAWRKKL